jgi:hypothetical protein
MTRGAFPALVGLLTLGFVIPSIAQRQGDERDTKYRGDSRAPDLNEAKEMAKLIEQGQASLSDATELAERHVNGTALEASCEIRTGEIGGTDDLRLESHNSNMPGSNGDPNQPPDPGQRDPNQPRDPNEPQDPNRPGDPNRPMDPNMQQDPNTRVGQIGSQDQGKRLIYEVCCFADNKVHKVRVDGKTKKVIGGQDDKMTSGTKEKKQQP